MSAPLIPKPQISVLCVEDDPAARVFFSRIIFRKFPDVRLMTAENGTDGLDIFMERRPEIVITDVRMPHMDGIQMAGKIKAVSPETVIIVVTAHSDTDYLLKAIEIGINHYVIKPVEHQKLISAIDKSISGINLIWQVKAQEAAIQQLASFTQISPNPVIETDLSGKITYYNEAATRTLRDITRCQEVAIFLPPDMDEILQAFRDGRGDQVNREIRINEAYFEENIHFARQFETVRIYAADITEREKMHEELLKAQKLESLGVMAGGIAHGFNNILTAILGNLSLARMQINPSHDIARRLGECEKAAVQASELAQQLLTFSSGGEPVKKIIDPAPLIRKAASFVLRGTNVRCVIELAESLWCLEADGGQFNQVLQNLLINAMQAMPGGGEVTVRAENELLEEDNPHQLASGHYLKVSIEDNGCGIAPEDLTRIFDPYFTTKPQGTGLGLSAVYSIIRKHGGKVEVSSAGGKGSCFSVHMPARPESRPEEDIFDKRAAAGESFRVLIMDDEEFVREIAVEIMEFIGYEVESCADGNEAVRLYEAARERNTPFNAVILDLTVPGGMGGKETAEQLLRIDPEAVLVVSSGYSNDPVVANFRQYGFSGVINKPFDAETLMRELERLMPAAGRRE